MVWNHQKVYEALVNKKNYEKESELNKYVSLDHHDLGNLNMVLYRPDTRDYQASPLHIIRVCLVTQKSFFRK